MNFTLIFTFLNQVIEKNNPEFLASLTEVQTSSFAPALTAIFSDTETIRFSPYFPHVIKTFSAGSVVVYNIDTDLSPNFKLCLVKPKNIVLFFNEQHLEEKVQNLREHIYWDARCRVLVIAKETVREWLDSLWRYTRAVDVAVMLQNGPPAFFTWFPYLPMECTRAITVEELSPSNLFPPKLNSDNFNKCQLNVVTTEIYPFVLTFDPDSPTQAGIEMELIAYFVDKYNFTLKFIPVPEDDFFWNTVNAEGRPGGALKMIYENQVDFAVGGLQRLWEYFRFSDMTVSHYEDYLSWFVPVPRFLRSIDKLHRAFSAKYWYCILISFWLVTGTVILASSVTRSVSVSDCIFNSVRAYLNSPVIMPKHTLLKYLFMVTYFYSLHITTGYQSGLFYLLSNQVTETPITTIEQAWTRNLEFYFYNIHEPLVNNSDTELWQEISKRNLHRFSMFPDYNLFIPQKTGLFLGSYSPTPHYLRLDGWVDHHGRVMATPLHEPFMALSNVIVTSPGHPLTRLIDDTVQRLLEGGFPTLWHIWLEEHNYSQHFAPANSPLTVEGLLGAFIFLGVFLVCSTFVFFIEIYWRYFSSCKRLIAEAVK